MSKRLKFIVRRAPTEKELKIMEVFSKSLVEVLTESQSKSKSNTQKNNLEIIYPTDFGKAFLKAKERLKGNEKEELA